MISDILRALEGVFAHVQWEKIFYALIFWIVGQGLIQVVRWLFHFAVVEVSNRQRKFLIQKAVMYTLNFILLVAILQILGITMKTILGAAGVLTVAIGFAARASISNLISGVFLIFERPFVVGDVIEVQKVKGEVLSIDLLSMSLRTLDNLLVRMPNDVVMGNPVLNHTHFPICRMDMTLMINYSENLAEVHRVLNEVVANNKNALEEPAPLFQVQRFAENYIEVIFWVWTVGAEVLEFKGHFYKDVHKAFRKAGITQPQASVRVLQSTVPEAPSKRED